MKHSTIIACLCECLERGKGINTVMAEINLTADWLKFLTPRDRVKLYQAREIYVEGLERVMTERARMGRSIGKISHALRMARENPLRLPDDDDGTLRAPSKAGTFNPNVPKSPTHKTSRSKIISPPRARKFAALEVLKELKLLELETDTPSPPTDSFSPPNPTPAPEKVEKPTCGHLRAEERLLEVPPEAPKPELRWKRLFTGRAVATDATGKVIKSLKPGAPGYPLESEFDNQRSDQ